MLTTCLLSLCTPEDKLAGLIARVPLVKSQAYAIRT